MTKNNEETDEIMQELVQDVKTTLKWGVAFHIVFGIYVALNMLAMEYACSGTILTYPSRWIIGLIIWIFVLMCFVLSNSDLNFVNK